MKDLRVLKILSVFDVSLFQQDNVNTMQAYKKILQKKDTCTKETMSRVERPLGKSRLADVTHTSDTGIKRGSSKKQ